MFPAIGLGSTIANYLEPMKANPEDAPMQDERSAASLSRLLAQSEDIKELVAESAKDLTAVNSALKAEIEDRDPLPWVEQALKKSELIESKVGEAAEKLASVNRALEGEIRDRVLLDYRFAAVKEQEESARHASFHDALTGLPNRALFNDRLEHAIAQARRHASLMAVMFLDLDNFKAINDSHGHDVGDGVLQMVAQRLKESARGDDTVSRLGGDEFLCLLSDVRSPENAALVAQKFIRSIQSPFKAGADDARITLNVRPSIGIAIFPKNGTTVDTLVISADLAMYRAKQSRDGYVFAA
jgi:diguanylate cyclase (GGDEF)-like protein